MTDCGYRYTLFFSSKAVCNMEFTVYREEISGLKILKKQKTMIEDENVMVSNSVWKSGFGGNLFKVNDFKIFLSVSALSLLSLSLSVTLSFSLSLSVWAKEKGRAIDHRQKEIDQNTETELVSASICVYLEIFHKYLCDNRYFSSSFFLCFLF